MIELGKLTRFPAFFRYREKLVDSVELLNININQVEGEGILATSNSRSGHSQYIMIRDDKIGLKSLCKIYCTCESFKYDFAYALNKIDSLYIPSFIDKMKMFRSTIKRPRERNVYNIPSPCKHIVKLARYLIRTKTKGG